MRSPSGPPGLLGLLERAAAGNTCRFVRYTPSAGTRTTLPVRELDQRSSAVGHALRTTLSRKARGPQEPYVLLAVRDPLEFVTAFFAVVKAGLIPVPGPALPHVHQGHAQRLRGIVAASRPRAVLTDQPEVAAHPGLLPEPCPLLLVDELQEPRDTDPPPAEQTDVAYVQYTSGSLGNPGPVALRGSNVIAQLRQAAEAFGETRRSVSVGWVPLSHDMGLVTGVLRPLWSGYTSVLLDPFDFVRDPGLWPRAMSEWKATLTSAPDFGYALCARKTGDVRAYDLSSLTVARSAGEPVRPATLRAFTAKFGPAGFDHKAFTPSYGLAEATLTVTAARPGEAPHVVSFCARGLCAGRAEPAARDAESQELASCGTPLRDTRVEILDPESGTPLAPGLVGEIWISGPQVAPRGHTVGADPGHRTGDMGFLHEGELFALGRAKERFQVAGENYYSGEIEAVAVAADERLRPGRAAVFLAGGDGQAAPRPVVVAECRTGVEEDLDDAAGAALARAVMARIGRETGLAVTRVWLVAAGALPVTTSGKMRRERCRDLFEDGSLKALHRYGKGE
ncbi:AMP-binding protein [Streptomyces sp. NBC_00441]|uniref:AMP-binding protein n=1 Tax=Streptomyces sp. NBC_00441 TaxID=2975742 RepID=UPI002E2A1964|nr:AMP-binding protein [Streptomyces sp. NBC_00441]